MTERGDVPAYGKPANVAKAILSFLGLIVQSAIIGEVEPDTAAKAIERLIFRPLLPRR
jgi:hypothetical protein